MHPHPTVASLCPASFHPPACLPLLYLPSFPQLACLSLPKLSVPPSLPPTCSLFLFPCLIHHLYRQLWVDAREGGDGGAIPARQQPMLLYSGSISIAFSTSLSESTPLLLPANRWLPRWLPAPLINLPFSPFRFILLTISSAPRSLTLASHSTTGCCLSLKIEPHTHPVSKEEIGGGDGGGGPYMYGILNWGEGRRVRG